MSVRFNSKKGKNPCTSIFTAGAPEGDNEAQINKKNSRTSGQLAEFYCDVSVLDLQYIKA